jgi:hypothetical protein
VKIVVSHWCLGEDCMRSVMVLPQVKYVAAKRHDFKSVLRENCVLIIEISHWYVCSISTQTGMVLPHAIHLTAERGRFDGVLGGNGAVRMEVSHWYLGVISTREGMVLPQLTSLATREVVLRADLEKIRRSKTWSLTSEGVGNLKRSGMVPPHVR